MSRSAAHRFRYVVPADPADGAPVVLGDADSHHLARVVRRRAGDEVEVIAPSGLLWPCVVDDPGPPAVLRVAGDPREAPIAPPVHLWVGLCDASRLDLIAEKAAELGALSLGVMSTARAKRVPDARAWGKRAERMARVAEAAARQSGRGTWPAPGPLIPFEHVLSQIVPEEGVILDPRATAPLAQVLGARPHDAPVALLVGPDTGFADDELQAAAGRGITAAGLGDGMLRTETAAIAALALTTSGREGMG
ncbi:MAG: RsmE family RNA methyltransferase [Actinomycetota bacterium]